jgi:muramoyltetrapeptide carboxypeptidase
MLSTYGKQTLQYNLETFQQVLSGQSNIKITSAPGCQARTLRAGMAAGPAWGGNLVLVIHRLGTSGQIDTTGAILLLEDIGEKLYSIDRMLVHLKRSGCLNNINGLVIGEMVDIGDSKVPFGKTTDEIVLDICSDFDFPIVSNFPSGHGDYQATLPISHEIELHALKENPFILIPKAPVA